MIEVTQGEEIIITIKLDNEDTGRPFDLTGYDEFKVCLPAEDGTSVEITETAVSGAVVEVIADPLLGEIQATFSAASGLSSLIKTEDELELSLEIAKSTDSPSKPLRKVFPRAIIVVPFNC